MMREKKKIDSNDIPRSKEKKKEIKKKESAKEKLKTKKVKKKKLRRKTKESEPPTTPHLEIMIICEEEEYYGIPLDYVDEIKKDLSLTDAPHLPEFLSGIIEISKVMVQVVDFSCLIGLRKRKKRKTPIIIVRVSNQIIGFQFDEVVEIIEIKKEDILPLPEIFPSIILSGAYDYNSKIVGILRLEGLLKGRHLQSLKELE